MRKDSDPGKFTPLEARLLLAMLGIVLAVAFELITRQRAP